MDLNKINKSLIAKEEWDIECLALNVYEEPGIDSSSLPIQKNIAAFFPDEISPYLHQGGGIDVSLESFCTCLSFLHQVFSQVLVPQLFHCPPPPHPAALLAVP
jgi:hypothetical protein